MGVEGRETLSETSPFAAFFGLPEAEREALGKDASLRDLMRLWSTLDQSVQQAILAMVRSSACE